MDSGFDKQNYFILSSILLGNNQHKALIYGVRDAHLKASPLLLLLENSRQC